ncbi:MAG: hypothetical protein WBI14_01705 [Anaerolineaceae bacterium]
MTRQKQLILLSQFLIALVLVSNLIAAISFVFDPQAYVGGFELARIPGEAAVVGIGILFLMWQVPYAFAVTDPVRWFLSLIEAIIMQIIGLVGESLLFTKIDPAFLTLRSSIARFILFDGLGLALLMIAWAIATKVRENQSTGGKHV